MTELYLQSSIFQSLNCYRTSAKIKILT